MPFLSVIVPAYNSAATIVTAVNSVLNQSFVDLELLVVDDGSTDETPALLHHLAEEDGRIRLFRQENAGVSAARNAALDRAEGQYVAFLDADDWLEPDAYAKLVDALRRTGADSAACGHELDWPDGRREFGSAPLDSGFYPAETVFSHLVLPLLNDRLSSRAFNGFSVRYLYRLADLRARGIRFSGAYLEDELFLIEFFAVPTTLVVVNEGLYHYLQNPESATRRYMAACVPTFLASLRQKQALVSRFGIDAGSDWTRNCAWAGLLIAVGNLFAPGSPELEGKQRFFRLRRALRALAREPVFADALQHYRPREMNRRKTVVAQLLRLRLYGPLSLLYLLKNRNRI